MLLELALSFVLVLALWQIFAARRSTVLVDWQQPPTYPLFGIYLFYVLPTAGVWVLGEDLGTGVVMSESISTKNYLEIFATGICALLTIDALRRNSGFWRWLAGRTFAPVLLLGSVYLASTLWSIFPLYTLLRAVQFLTLTILATSYLHSSGTSEKSLKGAMEKLLVHVNVLFIVTTIFGSAAALADQGQGFTFTLLKNNLWSYSSGLLLLLILPDLLAGKVRRLPVVLVLISFIPSFSLAATLALIPAAFVLLTRRARIRVLPVAVIAIVFLLLVILAFGDEIVALVAAATGRELEDLEQLTGRVTVWGYVVLFLQDFPLGSGFASDQTLIKDLIIFGDMSIISSAHNVFLEAYIAAKWIGVGLLTALYVHLWRLGSAWKSLQMESFQHAAVLYLLICGLANSGFGGSAVASPFAICGAILLVLPSDRDDSSADLAVALRPDDFHDAATRPRS